ncbi:G-PROTEIN-RECEP-F1-2 domain-containing protein [Aphelenchoides fujianensis]|nr:G-PROTEIN-RECEP-F1-2 domain-containing protein [Aphelenchoides fujianensis]
MNRTDVQAAAVDSPFADEAAMFADGSNETTSCYYEPAPYLEPRFYLVACFGSSVATVSFCANVFLFSVLCRKRQHRNSHCLYLMLLAFCDLSIAFSYVPLMSLNVLADWFESPVLLNQCWFFYFRPLITFSHVVMSASTYLILAACFERYCVTCWPSKIRFVNKHRRKIALAAIFLGFFTKISHFYEFELLHKEACAGTMAENDLAPSALAMDRYYNLFWRIGFRNLVTVWVPFGFLLLMNLKIVNSLRQHVEATVVTDKPREIERKKRVRSATRTFVCVTTSYLLANVLNVILTLWEYIDAETLTSRFLPFYSFGVDMVSILTILAGSFRPLIYFVCMPQLRKEILARFKTMSGRHRYKVDQLNSEEQSFGYASSLLMRISELLVMRRTSMETEESDESERKNSGEVFL